MSKSDKNTISPVLCTTLSIDNCVAGKAYFYSVVSSQMMYIFDSMNIAIRLYSRTISQLFAEANVSTRNYRHTDVNLSHILLHFVATISNVLRIYFFFKLITFRNSYSISRDMETSLTIITGNHRTLPESFLIKKSLQI